MITKKFVPIQYFSMGREFVKIVKIENILMSYGIDVRKIQY